MTQETIYYVGARVALPSMMQLCAYIGRRPLHQCHATLIYSRKWFTYKPARWFPIIIEPPYTLDKFGDTHVLRFTNTRLFERHTELRNAGGTWDYDDFKAHISIPPHGVVTPPDFHITLDMEYYMTWRQDVR